jgi:hypothetical protein
MAAMAKSTVGMQSLVNLKNKYSNFRYSGFKEEN